MTPFYIIANTLIGLSDALDHILLFLGIKKGIRISRNKDFERAGRESPIMHDVDADAAAKLNKAHQERVSETFEAGRRESQLLAGRNAVSQELREELTTEAKSVSRGSVVGHLARMNRKSASSSSAEDSTSAATGREPIGNSPEGCPPER